MNKYELFQAIGSISDEKLDEAISYHKEKKQNRLKKYAGLAASIGLISAGIFWGNYIKNEMHIYSNVSGTNGSSSSKEASSIENSVITFYNTTYVYKGQIVEEEDINSLLGEGTTTFREDGRSEKCKVYSIKGMSTVSSIAANINNKYYLYDCQEIEYDNV